MQQPREEKRMKREKKRYFLTKMIKKSPEGTPILLTFHFSLFTQGVLQIFATPPFAYQVFLTNFSRHLGQVMAILPFPLGTRTVCRHLGQV